MLGDVCSQYQQPCVLDAKVGVGRGGGQRCFCPCGCASRAAHRHVPVALLVECVNAAGTALVAQMGFTTLYEWAEEKYKAKCRCGWPLPQCRGRPPLRCAVSKRGFPLA